MTAPTRPVTLPLGARVVAEATATVNQSETLDAQGHGTNRGPFPDLCNRTSGSPLGSPWCAGAATLWFDRAGAARPPQDAGSCDEWVYWAKKTGRWKTTNPAPGDAVIYTNGKSLTTGRYAGQLDADHMGVVASPQPAESIEGNTSRTPFDRDGTCVRRKPTATTRVYGYVSATPK